MGKSLQHWLQLLLLFGALGGSNAVWASPPAASATDIDKTKSTEGDRAEFARLLKGLSDETESCLSLGQWAIDHDLFTEADELYRRFLLHHPADDDVHDALAALWRDRELPAESETFIKTSALLPRRFIEHTTARFIVLSDADLAWTRGQAENLERAYHQFLRFSNRLNLRPLPVRHKLVCVLFDNRDDYHAFASLYDDVDDPSIAGYYSPKNDRIVFYNPQNNPSVSRANEKLDLMQREVDELREELTRAEQWGTSSATDLRHTLAFREVHLEREQDKVNLFVDQTSVATTLHEAIHQLMFHTQVQTPYVQYPIWISEGLATSFETDHPNNAFGPNYEHAPRRARFVELLKQDDLLSIEELVQLMRLPTRGDETADVVYHQSYALIAWMARFRKAELTNYLMLMRERRAGRPSATEHLQIFEGAFGDAEKLERAWLRYETRRISLARKDVRPITLPGPNIPADFSILSAMLRD